MPLALRPRRGVDRRPCVPTAPGVLIRRHVFYIPGFDPRAPRAYWGLFRRESRLTAARRGLAITVGEPEETPTALTWRVEGDGPRGRAETTYTLLRWDDVVRGHFPRANWRRLVAVPQLWFRLVRSGYLAALRGVGRRFATIIVAVHLIFAALVALAVVAAAGLVSLIEDERLPLALRVALAAGLAFALLALAMAATRGRPFYVSHLVDDTAFTHRHAAGGAPEMAERLDTFAELILAARPDCDEIVVIGHSSGSFLAAEVLAKVLERSPGFGLDGPRCVFLTLGSVTPWITLDPAARRQRAALARVAAAPFGRIDILATWDWLSIPEVRETGEDGIAGRRIVLQVAFDHLVGADRKALVRYNLFRCHFQLLMASNRPEGFDYLAMVASPLPMEAFVQGCRTAEETALAAWPTRMAVKA